MSTHFHNTRVGMKYLLWTILFGLANEYEERNASFLVQHVTLFLIGSLVKDTQC